MRAAEVQFALRPLVAVTPGWSEDSIEVYVEKLMELDDPGVLATAAQRISTTWKAQRRPPLADILDEYRAEALRRGTFTPELPPAYEWLPPKQGWLIASQAYAQECQRQGREPNWDTFEKTLRGTMG